MIEPSTVQEMLCRFIIASATEDGARVATHCLYPSNGTVSVTIRGRHDAYVVSDDRGAVDEIASAGMKKSIPDRLVRRLVKAQGLKVDGGAIYSPVVPEAALPAVILLVANASKEVAGWLADHLKIETRRNFKEDLAALLGRHFHDNLKNDAPIAGHSTKLHKFSHVVYLHGGRKLLIDPAINETSSIYARLAANLDVRMMNDPLIQQFIVYDDGLRWQSSDLKLLEIGAPTLAFSRAEHVIMKHAA